ncbi:MAG: NUDIX domain-containing protein, partial [Alphaproteobacteria bacterium]
MMKYTTLCAIIDKNNNRILMIKKLRGMKGFSDKIDGSGKDLYNFPGGKCLQNESFFTCAEREAIEETGIKPIKHKLIGQLQFNWPGFTIINQVFTTEKWSGEIICKNNECFAE